VLDPVLLGHRPLELLHPIDPLPHPLEGVPVDDPPLEHVGDGVDLPLVEQLESGHQA